MTDKDNAPKTKQPDEKQPVAPSAKPDAAPVTPERTPDPDPDDAQDFGGLPSRDLRKNLGCGG